MFRDYTPGSQTAATIKPYLPNHRKPRNPITRVRGKQRLNDSGQQAFSVTGIRQASRFRTNCLCVASRVTPFRKQRRHRSVYEPQSQHNLAPAQRSQNNTMDESASSPAPSGSSTDDHREPGTRFKLTPGRRIRSGFGHHLSVRRGVPGR